jgi:hypothetical protein
LEKWSGSSAGGVIRYSRLVARASLRSAGINLSPDRS